MSLSIEILQDAINAKKHEVRTYEIWKQHEVVKKVNKEIEEIEKDILKLM